tara:strand:+ start:7172 stop:8410 length:1239 start_codon:yes stop_codon:yes gene_type:complete
VSTLFLISFTEYYLPSETNLRVILYFFFSLVIIKDIINANISWFYEKTKMFELKRFLYIYFLSHPFIIYSLSLISFAGLISLDLSTILLSGFNMSLQLLFGIYFVVNVNYKNFKQIQKVVKLFGWIFFIEYCTGLAFSISYLFDNNKFMGLVQNEWMPALIALLAFHFYITDFLVSKKIKYLLFSSAFIFLGYGCQIRIFFLALFIYMILTLSMAIKNKLKLFFYFSLTLFISIFAITLIGLNNPSFESLFDRFYLFSKQINLIINNIIFGVGGNISEKYYLETSPDLIYRISNFFNLELLNTVVSSNDGQSEIGYYIKRSSHSTLLDIIGDYGLLGIFISIFSLLYPLKIIEKMRRFYSVKIIDIEVKQSAIAFISLLGFYLLDSSGQYLWVGILLLSYLIYAYKLKKVST